MSEIGVMLEKLKRKWWPHLLPMAILLIAAVAIYGQMLDHSFLSNWDDNRYILENADIQGISWGRLQAVFSRYYVGNYAPVQMLSYMADYWLWGLWPGGYLLTNLVLHYCNTLLLYRLLLKTIPSCLAAFCGAALFLVHPAQVETVAWISQRKNLLAMLFFLLAWECYRTYRDSSGSTARRYYLASLIALLFAVLAKSIAVIFPVVIVLFDHCYYPASFAKRLKDKIPYLVVALAAAMLALLSQTPDYSEWGAGGGRAGYPGGSPWATFLTMLPVACSYLKMIVWPVNLSALYSPQVHKSPDLIVLAALLFLGALAFGLYRLYRYDRRLAFWPLMALVAFLPVSQIVPLVTLMNDRYMYFPMVGFAALVARVVDHEGKNLQCRWILPVIGLPLLLLSVLSFQRVPVWKNAQTLWRDTVSKSPGNYLAWEALGESLHYAAQPKRNEAIAAYRRAIQLHPGADISRYNLGIAYTQLNDYDNADSVLRDLLKLSAENVMGWTAFGDLALQRLEYVEAEKRYRKALSLQPEAFQVHQKIGNLMVILGRIDEARNAYLQVENIQGHNDPQNAYELARIEALAGDTGASIKWLETAMERGYSNFAGILADEELLPVLIDGRFADLELKYFPKKP